MLALSLSAGLVFSTMERSAAEDIDLFVGASATAAANLNVLIIVDNSQNWSRADNGWPNGEKQGQAELRAIRTVLNEVGDTVNMGLMMYNPGNGANRNDPRLTEQDGAYVRFHVRSMTAVNRAAFQEIIGTTSCVDGSNSVNGTPNCIFKNYATSEQIPTGQTHYGTAMFEAFKYFGGLTSPANAQSDLTTPSSPVSRYQFGPQRYSGTVTSRFDGAAYSVDKSSYISPITTVTSCAKNYIIFIGNGYKPEDSRRWLLTGVGGNATQVAFRGVSYTQRTESKIIGNNGGVCQNAGVCNSSIPTSLKAANPADSYACVNPVVGACTGGTSTWDYQATKTVYEPVLTGLNVAAPTYATPITDPINSVTYPANTLQIHNADEWARYLNTTDVSPASGQQSIATYTIDVFKDVVVSPSASAVQEQKHQTSLLMNMANQGGGRYFAATNEEAILNALREILLEIQSVNSAFASASLPINATNRSQNENQVYIGMFRPDPDVKPRWYGNLKRYQIGLFSGEAKLADADGAEVVNPATGFILPCARSFWTSDTGPYWSFSDTSSGQCQGFSPFSDRPDGPQVEKGAVAEILRRGNNPPVGGYTDVNALNASPAVTVAPAGVNRTIYTCTSTGGCKCNAANPGCGAMGTMDAFNTTNISAAAVSAFDTLDRDDIVNFTRGEDRGAPLGDDNVNSLLTDVRPSVHGDVTHSRPLPVNYGGSTGVVLFYGANDGYFRAVSGIDGKELWSFIAPEHHTKLRRLRDNKPILLYPGTASLPGVQAKDYFFDGSAGLYQTFQPAPNDSLAQNVWVFPSMRRGGRMIYAFDASNPASPALKWRQGCPVNLSAGVTPNDTGCTSGFGQIGQTWSFPNVALLAGYSSGAQPVVITGGGYDPCEDEDTAAPTCTSPKGRAVYVIDAGTGALIRAFTTGIDRSVASDVTLLDRNFDGKPDHGYFADTGGGLYRLDFVDPLNPATARAPADWTATKIAQVAAGSGRKFLFAPAALPAAGKVFLSIGSGDRERPLITNYPYTTGGVGIQNRFYMFMDTFPTSSAPVNLDGSTMEDRTKDTVSICSEQPAAGKNGWFIDLNTGRGEQTVTSSTIFGGLVFFSTNRPMPTPVGSCSANLGEARGYAVNLLNASGAVGTEALCGGTRSNFFVGGGLPPSPVTGTVPVDGNPVTVMIGGVQRSGAPSTPIGAQRVTPVITQKRSRVFWYTDGDQ
jgi:type IV pilus assembly protein PilY1